MGPTAVEEKVWSRKTTVTSITCASEMAESHMYNGKSAILPQVPPGRRLVVLKPALREGEHHEEIHDRERNPQGRIARAAAARGSGGQVEPGAGHAGAGHPVA